MATGVDHGMCGVGRTYETLCNYFITQQWMTMHNIRHYKEIVLLSRKTEKLSLVTVSHNLQQQVDLKQKEWSCVLL